MKKIDRIGAQGDVLFIRVEEVPKEAVKKAATGKIIVAHSETGHHHSVQADGRVEFFEANPFICYLRSEIDMPVIHERSFDTHETILLPAGTWQICRQREHTPEGFRRVED